VRFSEKYCRLYEVEYILEVRFKWTSEVMNECKTAFATNDSFFFYGATSALLLGFYATHIHIHTHTHTEGRYSLKK